MRIARATPPTRRFPLHLARTCAIGIAVTTCFVVAVVGLYAIKSKLGINLMRGPSPLHGVFVSMRRAGLV